VLQQAEQHFFMDKHQTEAAQDFMRSEEYKQWVKRKADEYKW